ncbi:D-alanyl-D-alanine carboxypeptidase, partial [bacterium]
LALIGREAMRNPIFAQIARTPRFHIERSMNKLDRWMVSRNKLLKEDPTADGIKTGWTIPAGHTYVGSATRDGHRLITAILDSPHWKQDHLELLKWGFGAFERRPVALRTMTLGEVPVEGGAKATVPVRPTEDVSTLSRKGEWKAPRLELPTAPVAAPVAAGQTVGRAVFVEADGFRHEVALVAAEPVDRAALPVAAAARVTKTPTGMLVIGGLFLGGSLYAFSRRRRPGRVVASDGFAIRPLRAAGTIDRTE